MLTNIAEPPRHALAMRVQTHTVIAAVSACLAASHVFVADGCVGAVRPRVLGHALTLTRLLVARPSVAAVVQTFAFLTPQPRPATLTTTEGSTRLSTNAHPVWTAFGVTFWNITRISLPIQMARTRARLRIASAVQVTLKRTILVRAVDARVARVTGARRHVAVQATLPVT